MLCTRHGEKEVVSRTVLSAFAHCRPGTRWLLKEKIVMQLLQHDTRKYCDAFCGCPAILPVQHHALQIQ